MFFNIIIILLNLFKAFISLGVFNLNNKNNYMIFYSQGE